ncbi:hypothetical protein D3C79_820010 [compost metagenome]
MAWLHGAFFAAPVLLPGTVLFEQPREMRQTLIERHCRIQCQLQRQGLLEQPQGLLEILIVSPAVMTPARNKRRATAQPRQQQPPAGLQQRFQGYLATCGNLLQVFAQGCRQLCLNLAHRAH